MKTNYRLILTLLAFTVSSQLRGQEHDEPGVHLDLALAHHEWHKHHAGLFLGGATRFEGHGHDGTGFTLGVDYEYRFARRWGVGGLLEGVVFAESHRDLAFAVPLSWHPIGALRLSAGPGFETDGHHADFLFRFSAAYGFELGKFTLSPELGVDLIDGAQTLVYGFSIGRGF